MFIKSTLTLCPALRGNFSDLSGAILTGATLSEADLYGNWIQIDMYRGPRRW
ncbi:MAG: pentapeptide repeat-containing protein [Desulfonatronovibrio sp.]